MRLMQPIKKNNDISLDMTMQVDANEELRDEYEEGKTNQAHGGNSNYKNTNSSDLLLDGNVNNSPHM